MFSSWKIKILLSHGLILILPRCIDDLQASDPIYSSICGLFLVYTPVRNQYYDLLINNTNEIWEIFHFWKKFFQGRYWYDFNTFLLSCQYNSLIFHQRKASFCRIIFYYTVTRSCKGFWGNVVKSVSPGIGFYYVSIRSCKGFGDCVVKNSSKQFCILLFFYFSSSYLCYKISISFCYNYWPTSIS